MKDLDQQFFMNPGPTPIPLRAQLASQKPMMSHRSLNFKELFQETSLRLKRVFQTNEEVLILTSSGTGAMEAALSNLFAKGDRVLGISIGVFGDRFIEIANRLHLAVDILRYSPGEAASTHEVIERIQEASPPYVGLTITHHETTTGVVNDLEDLAKSLQQLSSPPLLLVDAISSLGAIDIKTSQWNLDLVITSSQKALMSPPGLSMLSLSKRAAERIEKASSPSFYFDLKKAREGAFKGETPYTPAISLIMALKEALVMIEEEGLERVFRRHIQLRDALREGIRAMGLDLFAPDSIASPALTTFLPPKGIDVHQLRRLLAKEYGVILAGGKGLEKDKLLRIAHLGYFSQLDILATLCALEMALLQLGAEIEAGVGVGAAETRFLKEVRRE